MKKHKIVTKIYKVHCQPTDEETYFCSRASAIDYMKDEFSKEFDDGDYSRGYKDVFYLYKVNVYN